MYAVYRKAAVTLLALITSAPAVFAQGGMNKPFYDYSRWIHFGFTLGANYSHLKFDLSDYWYNQQDTFSTIRATGSPGLTLGAVTNIHVGGPNSYMREHLDLRLIPTLVLSQRSFEYGSARGINRKEIESAIVEMPVLLKLKSVRFTNLRYYVIGGGKYGYDLSSDAGASRDPNDPQVILSPHIYSYEYGVGLDLYFPYFKFSPEIKVSRGINNVLIPDTDPTSAIFNRLRSNFIFFSLYFEG